MGAHASVVPTSRWQTAEVAVALIAAPDATAAISAALMKLAFCRELTLAAESTPVDG